MYIDTLFSVCEKISNIHLIFTHCNTLNNSMNFLKKDYNLFHSKQGLHKESLPRNEIMTKEDITSEKHELVFPMLYLSFQDNESYALIYTL